MLQTGLEDLGYATRIARLRGFYFEHAPEVGAYLLSVPPERRVSVQGLRGGWWQHFLTVAGMTAVITSVLAGAGVALLVAILSGHSLVAALVSGGAVGVAALVALTRRQHLAWRAVEAEERARADASL